MVNFIGLKCDAFKVAPISPLQYIGRYISKEARFRLEIRAFAIII